MVHTADLHSSQGRNSFLYVFEYQTKFGDYQQNNMILASCVPLSAVVTRYPSRLVSLPRNGPGLVNVSNCFGPKQPFL
ncbi:unnamed protein product [Nezara viridula]|uniref:Uncharacterized protein n=1 Tax=Nezara viridula TaxID=85310 RepID=A0A9P0MW81_NEZVI|nr:unnamed protein product [Nezara viridula]